MFYFPTKVPVTVFSEFGHSASGSPANRSSPPIIVPLQLRCTEPFMRCVFVSMVVVASLLPCGLSAQDFAVYTIVFDLDAKGSNSPIARSRTLFHAGKVYDVITGSGEVTIMEPAHR